MIQYLAVRQQGGQYTPLGQPHDERAAALSAGYDEAGSPDFYVATLTDGRVSAYGWGIADFEAGSHDLAEIEKQLRTAAINEMLLRINGARAALVRIEASPTTLEAMRQCMVPKAPELAPSGLVGSVFGVDLIADPDMPDGAWRALDAAGDVVQEGTLALDEFLGGGE